MLEHDGKMWSFTKQVYDRLPQTEASSKTLGGDDFTNEGRGIGRLLSRALSTTTLLALTNLSTLLVLFAVLYSSTSNHNLVACTKQLSTPC
jgi:hypothetical protein